MFWASLRVPISVIKLSLFAATLVLVACSKAPDATHSAGALNREFSCKEPIPVFTLGPHSNPSDSQIRSLCACIWENLGTWERKTAQLISEHKESEASSLNIAAFPARFGSAIEKCGGLTL